MGHRNGHRPRTVDTRVGRLELEIPKLRQGSFLPSLLEPRRRIERALWVVIQEAWVHGVSTRKVDDLVQALGHFQVHALRPAPARMTEGVLRADQGGGDRVAREPRGRRRLPFNRSRHGGGSSHVGRVWGRVGGCHCISGALQRAPSVQGLRTIRTGAPRLLSRCSTALTASARGKTSLTDLERSRRCRRVRARS